MNFAHVTPAAAPKSIEFLLAFRKRLRSQASGIACYQDQADKVLCAEFFEHAEGFLRENARHKIRKRNRLKGMRTLLTNMERRYSIWLDRKSCDIETYNSWAEVYFCSDIKKFLHWHYSDPVSIRRILGVDGDEIFINNPNIKKLKRCMKKNHIYADECNVHWEQVNCDELF